MENATQAADRAAMYRTLPAALFAGLLAISADAVIALDDQQRIIFFNEGAERIFGFTAADVGGKQLEILMPARFRTAHRGHVQGFGDAHGRGRLMGERQHIFGLRSNGDEFPCEASIERLEVDGLNVYAAVLRDISARQRTEDAIREAVIAREDMLGIVSHDLRNPANAVKMLVRSMLDEEASDQLPVSITERLIVILQAAEQMDTLIQDLLDTTRLAGGRLSVNLRSADANDISSRSVAALRPLADAGRVALANVLPDALPRIFADPERIAQLLSNLLGNAIKFTPPGGTVTLSAQIDSDDILFVVRDTGDGIPADQLAHVFERFYQAPHTSRSSIRHGAGLGLPISRGIVDAHGGSIWIESTPGLGTTVRFSLPIMTAADPTSTA